VRDKELAERRPRRGGRFAEAESATLELGSPRFQALDPKVELACFFLHFFIDSLFHFLVWLGMEIQLRAFHPCKHTKKK